MPLTSEQIHDALRTVKDPDLGKDIVTLRMVKDVQVRGDDVKLGIELTTPACPLKDRLREDIERAVQKKAADAGLASCTVEVEFSAEVRKPGDRLDRDNPLPEVTHVIAVGAGKGGVGKSTVALNLAMALSRLGARAGLLDGDIYGPSITTMLGLEDVPPPELRGKTLLPYEVFGIRAMTIGKLVPPDRALIWRGPMAHNAFKQLATQTDWGALDYLIVDLPPGTGDVPLTLTQLLPLTGAVVVCTPQRVALDDARRAVRMFQQLNVAILGIVENMSDFVGDDGKVYDLFGHGGAELMAQEMNLPFLGALHIHRALRINSDAGRPDRNWEAGPVLAEELETIAKNVAAQVSIATLSGPVQPTIRIT